MMNDMKNHIQTLADVSHDLRMAGYVEIPRRLDEAAEDYAALEAENERLRAIVERLPKTADGVSVVPRQDWVFLSIGGVVRELHVQESQDGEPSMSEYDVTGAGKWMYVVTSDCYSTIEAAEAAAASSDQENTP